MEDGSSSDDDLFCGLSSDDFIGVSVDEEGSDGEAAPTQALDAASAREDLRKQRGKTALAQLAEAQLRHNETTSAPNVRCTCRTTTRLASALRRRIERLNLRAALRTHADDHTPLCVFALDSGEYYKVGGGTCKRVDGEEASKRSRAALRVTVEINGKRSARTAEELEILLGCIYVIGNHWESRHFLFQYPLFGYGLSSDLPRVPNDWGAMLDTGETCEAIYLAKVPELEKLVDSGWGVYASSCIQKDSFIGEYAGMVRESSEWSNYGCTYVSLYERPIGVCAKEYGNFGRCINHSVKPNVTFRQMLHREMVRVVIVSINTIQMGDQLLLDYGSSYWAHAGYKPLELSN
jgi:hypothetical protein